MAEDADPYAAYLAKHGPRLVDMHVRRYTNLLTSGRRQNVRATECVNLIATWEGIRDKGFEYEKLSHSEKMEVIDAVQDEIEEEQLLKEYT